MTFTVNSINQGNTMTNYIIFFVTILALLGWALSECLLFLS